MNQVDRATHEAAAWLYYAPVNDTDAPHDWDGLDPYWALSDLLINEFDGYHELSTEIDGEHWDLRFNYSKSGFTPRVEDDVDGDRLYEFDLHGSGRGERKIHYNISPRYDNMLNSDGESTTTAFDHTDPDEGLSIQCNTSNVKLDDVPDLLPRFIFEFADAADVGIYHGYFEAPFDGRISAVERYVRIQRDMNEKLIGKGGILDRLSMLLSDCSGTKGMLKWDNVRARGHHHVLRHGSTSATEMSDQHRFGGQIKSYLPEHPENFEPEDPLYHPKVGVKFAQGRNDRGAVSWSERDRIVDELDERLLSVLAWADIPTEAGGTTFVADDHFDATAADEFRPIHADPTPRLEAKQEHLLLRTLDEMTPAHKEVTEIVATDGGIHVRDLAEAADRSLSTIYRALESLEGIITSDNGYVRFVSEKLREEVRAIVDRVDDAVKSAADRAAQLLDIDVRQSASSAFDRWLAKFGGEFERPDGDADRPVVRIGTVLSRIKSGPSPLVQDVIDDMLSAWQKDGRDVADLDDAIVEMNVRGTDERRPVATLR